MARSDSQGTTDLPLQNCGIDRGRRMFALGRTSGHSPIPQGDNQSRVAQGTSWHLQNESSRKEPCLVVWNRQGIGISSEIMPRLCSSETDAG